jgi:DNA repair protein RadA/Sms
MPKSKIVFLCRECGRESARWLGRCPACNAWNSFVEQTVAPSKPSARAAGMPSSVPQELSGIESGAEARWQLMPGEL